MTGPSSKRIDPFPPAADFVRADEVRLTIIGSFCHDLRQPLNAALLRTSALMDDLGDPAHKAVLNEVQLNLKELATTSEVVFDAIRLSRSAIPVQVTSTSVPRVFLQLRRMFEPQAVAKGLRIRFRAGSLIAETDEWLLSRILQNLIGNAIKFTTSGSIAVSATRAGDVLRCEVRDTGPGMRVDEVEGFAAGTGPIPSHRRSGLEGSGLGLWNCREFARLIGADLTIVSEPGRGTCIRLEVPCRLSKREGATREAQTPTGDRSVTVLCEDAVASKAMERAFVEHGWRCVTFADPLRFLATFSTPGFKTSLVVMPVRIAAVTADFLLRILRSRFDELAVIVIASDATDPEVGKVERQEARVVIGDMTATSVAAVLDHAGSSTTTSRR